MPSFVREELISEAVAQNMLSWPHSGFHVHVSSRLMPDDGDALGATARYAARAPIALERLHYEKGSREVSYTYTSSYDQRERTERIGAGEFIARLATHIPGHHERLIRYYGHMDRNFHNARLPFYPRPAEKSRRIATGSGLFPLEAAVPAG